MHRTLRALYVGGLLVHLLLVALICGHETIWLIEKNLTVANEATRQFCKKIDVVPTTLLALDVPSSNPFRRSSMTYANLTGIEVGYGYFAPNVPVTHALVFELHYPDGHFEYEPPLIGSHEGELRLASLIEQVGRTDYDDWRNELIKRLARSAWQRHSAAKSVRAFFGSVNPPELAEYRSGKRERRFTCQYVYDFEQKAPREKARLQ